MAARGHHKELHDDMRRTRYFQLVSITLAGLGILGLSGCGSGDAKTLGPVPTSPTTTAPTTTAPTTTAPATTVPPTTSTTAALPTSRPPTTTTPPPTTVKPVGGGTTERVACASVGFAPNSDDVAGSIVATGMGCAEAEALVRKVGAQVRAVGGPSQVVADGFTCVRTSENDGRGLPSSDFECTSGSRTITFRRT